MHIQKETQKDHNATNEVRLWQTVIVEAIEDWRSGSARRSREAEKYLFENNTDFPMVCQSAGMDIGRLRSELAKLRHPSLRPEYRPLAA